MIAADEHITTTELCARAHVSRETVRNWRARGLPYFQVSPHCLRYDWREVIAWMSEQGRTVDSAKE